MGRTWNLICQNTCIQREKEGERTFEKWYPSGTDTVRFKLPSLDVVPSTTIVCVSAEDRLLRRLGDLDFGAGGWTPFSSRVRSCASCLLRSRYLIWLLFVSAMNSLPGRFRKEKKKNEVTAWKT